MAETNGMVTPPSTPSQTDQELYSLSAEDAIVLFDNSLKHLLYLNRLGEDPSESPFKESSPVESPLGQSPPSSPFRSSASSPPARHKFLKAEKKPGLVRSNSSLDVLTDATKFLVPPGNETDISPSDDSILVARRRRRTTDCPIHVGDLARAANVGQQPHNEEEKEIKNSSPDSGSFPGKLTIPTVTYSSSPPIEEPTENQKRKLSVARRFNSKVAPKITTLNYLQRLHKYCPMSVSVYLAASWYIYKLSVDRKTLHVTSLSVHRLISAALRIAVKVIEDIIHKQERFCNVAGLTVNDMFRMEIALLFLMDFDVSVTVNTLKNQLVNLQRLELRAATAEAIDEAKDPS